MIEQDKMIVKTKRDYTRQRGSILILALWALGLLTVFSLYVGFNVRQKLVFLDKIETRNKLYLIADAGIKKMISVIGNVDKEILVSSLTDPWSNDENMFSEVTLGDGKFTVGWDYQTDDFRAAGQGTGEKRKMFGAQDVQSRININTAEHDVLVRLIENVAGVDTYTADIIGSSIIDWRDEDNLSLPNGAEDKYYRSLRDSYNCKDLPFETLEELSYVKGMNNDILQKIKPYITIFGSGTVNINTTSRPVLEALGLGEPVIKKIIEFRCGEDAVEATADDFVFKNANAVVAELSQVFSLSPSEDAQLSNLIAQGAMATFSDTFLIEGIATLQHKKGRCRISCVLQKDYKQDSDKAGWILSWRTEYFV